MAGWLVWWMCLLRRGVTLLLNIIFLDQRMKGVQRKGNLWVGEAEVMYCADVWV